VIPNSAEEFSPIINLTKPASAPITLQEEGRIEDEGQGALNGYVVASARDVALPPSGVSWVEQGRRQKSIRTSRPDQTVP
jgi:hypothetical protein